MIKTAARTAVKPALFLTLAPCYISDVVQRPSHYPKRKPALALAPARQLTNHLVQAGVAFPRAGLRLVVFCFLCLAVGLGRADVQIGVIVARTGPASFIGEPEGRLLEALITKATLSNAIPGVGKVQLLVRDSGGSAAQAQLFLDEFIANTNVIAVIGPSTSGEAIPLAAKAYTNQIALLALAANKRLLARPDDPTQINPWAFKFAQNDDLGAEKLLALIATQRRDAKIALFHSEDAFGLGGAEVMSVADTNNPLVTVAYRQAFPVGLTNANDLIANLPTGLDGVVIWSTAPVVVPLIAALHAKVSTLPVYLSHGNASASFLSTVGTAGEGIYLIGSRVLAPAEQLQPTNSRDAVLLGFQSFWESQFADPPSHFAGHARDALVAAIQVLSSGGTNRQSFRDRLEQVRSFDAVTGTFNFSALDHAGLDLSAFEAYTVKAGQFSLLPPAFRIVTVAKDGTMDLDGAYTNGIVTIEKSTVLGHPRTEWFAVKSKFTTGWFASIAVPRPAEPAFYRALKLDLSQPATGFSNLIESYSTLTTIAGAGGASGTQNKWQTAFENRAATNALLSRPHIAMADDAGNIFIADKEGHAVRRIAPDGTIATVAGINQAGDGPDTATPGTQVALNQPNGLWTRKDGTVYVLDLANGKVRRLDTNGIMTLLFSVPGGIRTGRGIWVADDESTAYVSSGNAVKQWTRAGGVTDFASGFSQLGNLAVDPLGAVVVTDPSRHAVYRLSTNGTPTRIAGTESTADAPGGGDGGLATLTALNGVRAIWFLPTGAYFLGTESSCQLWYVDTAGFIHLFLHGSFGAHAGDGTYFYSPREPRISNVKQITVTRDGDLLITENDAGYVRKVRFLHR